MENKETIYRQDVLDLAKKGVLVSNGNYKSVCKAINDIPSVNLMPCEDSISRQAVLDAIDVKAWEFCDYLISKNRNDEQKPVSHFADNLRECVREELPSVNPQPCGDVISRQAAKRALEDRFMELQKRHDDKRYETNYCLNTILELPPVNPTKTGYWIPVSERLPKIDEPVLIFQRYYSGVNITIGRYHSDEEQGGYRYWQWIKYDNHFSYGIDNFGIICPGSYYVDAWMPLPKPYEPQERSDKE